MIGKDGHLVKIGSSMRVSVTLFSSMFWYWDHAFHRTNVFWPLVLFCSFLGVVWLWDLVPMQVCKELMAD